MATEWEGAGSRGQSTMSELTERGRSGEAPALEGVMATSPVLIGRDRELRALVGAVSRSPALAVVSGEAGLGKTRLVSEVLRHTAMRERRQLTGRCRPMRQPFVLEPLIDALRGVREQQVERPLSPVTGVLRPLLPELHRVLAPAPRDSHDPVINRHLLFRAVLDVLGSLGPTVCVLEDLHWADTHTAEFMRFAESHLPPNLSVVVTFRREDLADASPLIALASRPVAGVAVERVALTPLTLDEVRPLLAAILGTADISEEFVAFVHGRTEGVPYAVEEVVRHIVQRQDLVLHHGRWIRRAVSSLTVPESIDDAVAERVARLGPAARAVVEAAAIVAAPADLEVLAAVAGLPQAAALDALRDGLGSGLLVDEENGRCGFRHALANQAVYDRIPRATRRRLHGRAAEALELVEPRPVAVLAHHYRAAGGRQEWLECAEAAADLAFAVHDDATAVDLLRGVVADGELPPGDLSRVSLALARAAVRGLTARPDVIALLHTVLADGDLPGVIRGELRFLLGILLVTAEDGAGGHREWELAVTELEDRPDLAVTVMTHLAYPWVGAGTGDDHLRWLRRAAEEANSCADPVAQMMVASSRAGTLLALGDPDAWDAVRALPVTTPPAASSPEATRMLVWGWLELGGTALLMGHIARARELLDTGTRIAEQSEYLTALGAAEASALGLRWVTGSWAGLEAEADRLADAYADSPLWAIQAAAVAGLVAATRGDLDKSERLFQVCLAAAKASAPTMYALASGELARIRLRRGEPEAAWDVVAPGLEALESKQIWAWSHWVLADAVDAMIATGRLDEAASLVKRVEVGLRGREAPWSEAAFSIARGLVAGARQEHAEAAIWFADAERRYGAMPHPYEAARALERHALVLLAGGEPGGADGLQEAVGRFVTLGATHDERRVRRELRRQRIPQPSQWRGGRAGYGDRLSPREEVVARLAARGRNNVEIARELFLSPKTVEHHIGACMRKLKVRSRIELANRINAGDAPTSAVGGAP